MIRAPIRLACVLSLAALCGLRADPTTFTWSGELSSDVNTVGNWTVDGVPAVAAPTAADTLIFGEASRTNLIFTAGSAVAKVVIGGSAEPLAYTFGGTTASLSLAGASGEGLLVTGNTKVAFAPMLTINVGGSQTWSLANGTTAYVDGPISSPSAVTLRKEGSGELHVRGVTDGLSGTVAVDDGMLALWTGTAFENAAVSVSSTGVLASFGGAGTTIGSAVSLGSGAKLGSSESTTGPSKLVFTGTVTAGNRVVLAESSQSYFEGAFTGSAASTDVTFSGGGLAILKGTTNQVASFTADGAGLIIDATNALPTGSLQASSHGYLGLGAGFVANPSVFTARITSPESFSGTLGLDSDPAGLPNVFTSGIDLANFTHDDFRGLGSATHANLTGAITLRSDATAYKFGGGGGRLTVGSGMTGSFGLSVVSPATAPLTLVLTGDNRALAGPVTVQNSYLVFDSANAVPAGTISLGSSGYVSATATAGLGASTLLGKIASANPTAVLGFDSSQPASTARTVSDSIALGNFTGYLGTTTFKDDGLTLTGTITGPTTGVLKLAGLNNGKLTIVSPLLSTNSITSIVVGHPDPELGRNGTVVLSGTSDYTGGTTLQRGTLLLGSSSAGDGSTGPLGKSTGALTVKHHADGEAAVLAPAASATLLNGIILEADSYLRVGRDTGNLTLGGNMSGGGQLWFVGPTVTTLAGVSTREGDTYVQDTTVNVQANTGLASTHLFLINSTVAFGSAASAPTIGSLSGTSGSVMSFGAASTTLTINQTLESNPVIENKYAGTFQPSGTLSLVKTGSASLWFSEANTIGGDVTVNAGALGFSGSGNIGGELKVNSGSVNFANTGIFTTGSAYIGNQADQTGSVEIFTGSTWASTGWVKVGAASSAIGFLTIENGATLQAGGPVYIGHANDSEGTLQVTGSGATLSAPSLMIADGTNAKGTLLVDAGGTVSISGNAEIRHAGLISVGQGSFTAGTVTVDGGTLSVGAGQTLTFVSANRLVFSSGTLAGSGTFSLDSSSSLLIGASKTISPGLDVPGALTFNLNNDSATLTFDSNGTYLWRLQDDAGSGTLASSIHVTGTLNIATNLVPFHLKLATFNASGAAGPASNFDPSSPMSWTLLTATSITGFDAAKFAIDAGLFSNATDSSLFSLAQSGNSLVLNFTPVPEPSTWALMLTGLSVVALRAFRRRRQS